jgi:hypothetical protein
MQTVKKTEYAKMIGTVRSGLKTSANIEQHSLHCLLHLFLSSLPSTTHAATGETTQSTTWGGAAARCFAFSFPFTFLLLFFGS